MRLHLVMIKIHKIPCELTKRFARNPREYHKRELSLNPHHHSSLYNLHSPRLSRNPNISDCACFTANLLASPSKSDFANLTGFELSDLFFSVLILNFAPVVSLFKQESRELFCLRTNNNRRLLNGKKANENYGNFPTGRVQFYSLMTPIS